MKKAVLRIVLIYIVITISQSCSKDSNVSNSSATVSIGNQIWMAKNLDVDHYRNGDPIPQVTNPTIWANLTTGAWCYYDNNLANRSDYGKLYNWYAVNDPRGLAPIGYHVASDNEWKLLISYLDPNADIEANINTAGSALKEMGLSHWSSPNTGATNNSGFTALPGGFCNEFGSSLINNYGFWWSASEKNVLEAWNFTLYSDMPDLQRLTNNKASGFSVRCLKD